MTHSMRTLLNIVQSQVGWFACVLSAAAGRPAIGIAIACVLIGVHLARVDSRVRELRLVLLAGLLGGLADTALVQLGVLRFPGTTLIAGFTTPWMIALWAVFATTMMHALAWMQDRLALAALVGAIGGPVAYFAGARLGALQINDVVASYLAIGVEWAVALPVLLVFARRAKGESHSMEIRSARWT